MSEKIKTTLEVSVTNLSTSNISYKVKIVCEDDESQESFHGYFLTASKKVLEEFSEDFMYDDVPDFKMLCTENKETNVWHYLDTHNDNPTIWGPLIFKDKDTTIYYQIWPYTGNPETFRNEPIKNAESNIIAVTYHPDGSATTERMG